MDNVDSSLTFAEFSKANLARCEASDGFNHKLNSWSLSDWFTATMGELGEAANVAKKLNRVRDGITGNKESEAELRAKLRSEIADAFIYLDLMAQSEGFILGEAVQETFNAKSEAIGYPVVLGVCPTASRLVIDPEFSESSLVIRGTWVTVDVIVAHIVAGRSWSDILRLYPEINEDDIRACLVHSIESSESA